MFGTKFVDIETALDLSHIILLLSDSLLVSYGYASSFCIKKYENVREVPSLLIDALDINYPSKIEIIDASNPLFGRRV